MQIDESKLSKVNTPGYLASYGLSVVLLLVLFVVFGASDTTTWPARREVMFAAVSASIAAIVGLLTFAMRHRIDPAGVIFGLPEGMSAAQLRRTIRTYFLFSLLGVLLLGWMTTLLLPPCAMERSCIDFSDSSLLLAGLRSLLPFIVIIGLGRSAANLVCYSILYFRSSSSSEP